MAIKIRKASKITYPLRLLAYGDSGVGKTYLAMQAALVDGMAPALLVACDMGTSTARGIDIDVVELDAPSVLSAVLRSLGKGQLPYKTVIIDGFSMYYDRLVYAKAADGVPTIHNWMTASVDVKQMMQKFVRLGINIIVTSLAQKLQEESTGQFYTAPLLPGKMAWRFAEAFDIVGYVSTTTKRNEVLRTLQVQPYRRVIAKDRGDTIGEREIDITWKTSSDKPCPLSLIWTRWTAYKQGGEPEAPMPIVELDEDDIEHYEAGDLTEGGDVDDVFS